MIQASFGVHLFGFKNLKQTIHYLVRIVKKCFGVMVVSFGKSVLFQKLVIIHSFTFPPHLGQLLGSPSSPGMTEQSEAPAY